MEDPINLSHQAIDNLLSQAPQAPAITIYLPTHRAATPPNMTEDQIRFKNLVHKAVEILKNRDDGREVEKALCDRLEHLLENRQFWESQTEGLLICGRPDSFTALRLPIDTEEYVAVTDHFHLAPIFGALNDMREYYVLVVAQHAPALYKGDMFDLYSTDLRLPETVEAGLNLDETNQKSEQQRSAEGASSNAGSFNGRGGARDPRQDDRQRFWRLINQKVHEFADSKLPLVLAGVESDIAEFKAESNYPNILKDHIAGSFSGTKPHDLFDPALTIIRKTVINPAHDEVITEYQRAKGQAPDQAAHDMAAITKASEAGRIDKLLLAGVRYTTDTVRDNSEPVPVLTFPPEESAQAVHDIAYQVWNASGQVVNIEADHMPEPGALMLATLRY